MYIDSDGVIDWNLKKDINQAAYLPRELKDSLLSFDF